jgi:hypothetical protein
LDCTGLPAASKLLGCFNSRRALLRASSQTLLQAATLVLATSLMSPGSALAQSGGKPYATVGNWQIHKFSNYCVAKAGFDGDRAMRLHASASGTSSFGFMGMGTANFTKSKLSFKFNNNRNKFTRDASPRKSQAEDGGAPWVLVSDPANEPSHAGDWASAKSITFDYFVGHEQLSETFDLRGISQAWEKVWACSGG